MAPQVVQAIAKAKFGVCEHGMMDCVEDEPGNQIERSYNQIQKKMGQQPFLNPREKDVRTEYQRYWGENFKHMVHVELQQFHRRASYDQWYDENEREWYAMDTLFRRRLVARWGKTPSQLPKRIEYPFRDSGDELRKSGEPLLGDDKKWPRFAPRGPAQGEEVMTQIVHPKNFPPRMRILYFTPIFGSDQSAYGPTWQDIEPYDDVDIWAVSWQGWSNFDDMLSAVARNVRSFADNVSNIFYGHSMGGIVAYEVIKRLETESTPHRPLALVVSGCPAPHLFPAKYNSPCFDWLEKLKKKEDFSKLTTEQETALQTEHGVVFQAPYKNPLEIRARSHAGLADTLGSKTPTEDYLDNDHRVQIMNDLKCMRSYPAFKEKKHSTQTAEDKKIYHPVYVFGGPNDDFVEESDMKAWAQYTKYSFDFKVLEADGPDSEIDERMHAFSQWGCKELLSELSSILLKHELPDKNEMLPDIGPTDTKFPDYVQALVIGAGIAGTHQMRYFNEQGIDAICAEMKDKVGGVWVHWGNEYSRVNTSEAAYRMVDQGDGPEVRVLEDHSPCYDVRYDIHSVAAKHGYGKFRLGWECVKTEKQDTRAKGRYLVTFKNTKTEESVKVATDGVVFAVNRRLGKKRWLKFPEEDKFRGEVYYGFGNEVLNVDWHNKKVLVVGCGAFAYENMRTSLEHGAMHAGIICRRRGTVCPKFIDIITFFRPFDAIYQHPKSGDAITFGAWNQVYNDAYAPVPECWKEGLLKPNGHTVSVSDVFYQASRVGMADCTVTEIRKFRADGHGAIMTDGTSRDFDILIKCTGFHVNKDVEKITGKDKMVGGPGIMDVNMFYQAEPQLDAGQFGSPFGSSYLGGMATATRFYAQMFKATDFQETLLPMMRNDCPVGDMWASDASMDATQQFKDSSKKEMHTGMQSVMKK